MKRKLIIFDLDGTLYKLRGGSYEKSTLKKKVIDNARKFIANKLFQNKIESLHSLNYIQKKYGEKISIGVEKEFNLSRYEYFNFVWNIPAHNIVRKNKSIRKILLTLNKDYKIALLSDAPKVWINNVLNELDVKDIFKTNIFSGEGNIRKEFGSGFLNVINKMKVKAIDCIAIGDQENSDIIPAKKIGMKTIFINQKLTSKKADYNIKSFNQIPATIYKLNNY